ncbi:Glycosyltransferase involved in cell wall bisynthesis [Butyrivibrio sp. INlla18]|nr:Glycosyltransferase involved in cell wall bisynthesis [Butyrivibrio sp. INlla18]
MEVCFTTGRTFFWGGMDRDSKIKISVIVPVFNGERYLGACLKSLLNQTLDGIEIIVVDNGSTDNSLAVVEELIDKWADKRKIYFIQESKQGNSYARNLGMKHAQGEYIAFSDQDDHVERDFFERMYGRAKELDADVLVSGYQSVDSNGNTKRIMKLTDDYWSPFRMTAPWGKLYKRELIEEHEISFLPVNKGEDVYFSFNAYNQAERLFSVPIVGYSWFSNSESLSHTQHRQINENNSILPLFDKLQESLYPLKTIKKEYLEYFFIKTIAHETMFCARGKPIDVAYAYFEEMCKWIDENYPENERNSNLSFFTPVGEEFKRRIFITWFWHMKKKGTIKRFLSLYVKIAG